MADLHRRPLSVCIRPSVLCVLFFLVYINPSTCDCSPASWPVFCFGLAARRRFGFLCRPPALRLFLVLFGLPSALLLPQAPIYRCPVSRLFSLGLVLPPGLSFLLASLSCLVAEVRDLPIYYFCSRVLQNSMVLRLVSFSSVSSIGLDYKKLVSANIDFARLYHMHVFEAFRRPPGICENHSNMPTRFRETIAASKQL